MPKPKIPKRKPKRGLASVDKATKLRVSTAGGLALSKDRKHMQAIGRKGGETLRRVSQQ